MKWFYRASGTHMRVWRSDWARDMFEVFSPAEFDALNALCARLHIPLEEAED